MSSRMTIRVQQVLGTLSFLFIVFYLKLFPSTVKSAALTNQPKQNILDGCRHVYLDMGTNM